MVSLDMALADVVLDDSRDIDVQLGQNAPGCLETDIRSLLQM
jgi:hypothetical protein